MQRWQGIVEEKKILYEWGFDDISRSDENIIVEHGKRGKYCRIPKCLLIAGSNEVTPPEMSLRATAEYFVNKLNTADRKALSTTMNALDGKTIKVGSTCSGTDVIIPVMHWTFHTLSQMFNVTCSAYSTVLYSTMVLYTVSYLASCFFASSRLYEYIIIGFSKHVGAGMQLEYTPQLRYRCRYNTFSQWRWIPKNVISLCLHMVGPQACIYSGMLMCLLLLMKSIIATHAIRSTSFPRVATYCVVARPARTFQRCFETEPISLEVPRKKHCHTFTVPLFYITLQYCTTIKYICMMLVNTTDRRR